MWLFYWIWETSRIKLKKQSVSKIVLVIWKNLQILDLQPWNSKVFLGHYIEQFFLTVGQKFFGNNCILFWPTVRKIVGSQIVLVINRTIYSNCERSEQFLVTECFLTCSWRLEKYHFPKFRWFVFTLTCTYIKCQNLCFLQTDHKRSLLLVIFYDCVAFEIKKCTVFTTFRPTFRIPLIRVTINAIGRASRDFQPACICVSS